MVVCAVVFNFVNYCSVDKYFTQAYDMTLSLEMIIKNSQFLLNCSRFYIMRVYMKKSLKELKKIK